MVPDSRAGSANCALVGMRCPEKMPGGGSRLKSGCVDEKMGLFKGVKSMRKSTVQQPFSDPWRRRWRKRGVAGCEHIREHPILQMERHSGLESIPENANHVSEYERKQQDLRRGAAKAEKKAQQKEELAQKRHDKLERYRRSLRIRQQTHEEPWREVRRRQDGLNAPLPRRVEQHEVQSEPPSSFPHSFRDYGNSDRDGMLDEAHDAMALVAEEEYRHLYLNQDVNQGLKPLTAFSTQTTTPTSFGAVVHQLLQNVGESEQAGESGVVPQGELETVMGSMEGVASDRMIKISPVSAKTACQAALASVGMGSATIGGVERMAAGSVSELESTEAASKDFYEALREHNAILLEEAARESFRIKPSKRSSGRSMRMKKRTYMVPSEVGCPRTSFFNKSSPPGRPRANLGSNPGGDTQVRDMLAPLTIFYIADIMICFVFLYRKHSLRKIYAMMFARI